MCVNWGCRIHRAIAPQLERQGIVWTKPLENGEKNTEHMNMGTEWDLYIADLYWFMITKLIYNSINFMFSLEGIYLYLVGF